MEMPDLSNRRFFANDRGVIYTVFADGVCNFPGSVEVFSGETGQGDRVPMVEVKEREDDFPEIYRLYDSILEPGLFVRNI